MGLGFYIPQIHSQQHSQQLNFYPRPLGLLEHHTMETNSSRLEKETAKDFFRKYILPLDKLHCLRHIKVDVTSLTVHHQKVFTYST